MNIDENDNGTLMGRFIFKIDDMTATMTEKIDNKICELWEINKNDVLAGIRSTEKLQKIKDKLVEDKNTFLKSDSSFAINKVFYIDELLNILEE